MKEPYIWNVTRDITYTWGILFVIYNYIEIVFRDSHISLWEWFLAAFTLFVIIILIWETENEKKPRRFTVKVDWREYQADHYELNIMERGSHIRLNGDEYVAIDDIDSVEIIRNPGHPDKKPESTPSPLMAAIAHIHEFHNSHPCECPTWNAESVMSSDTGKTGKKRHAPNKGKKMTEEQKRKIYQSLKKYNKRKVKITGTWVKNLTKKPTK